MKDFDNIEDLFKDNLGDFEVDPGAGVWENISQQITTQTTAATGTAVATTKAAIWKTVAAIVLAGGGIGIATVYFLGENNEKPAQKPEEKKEITATKEENGVIIENTEMTVVQPENTDLQQKDVIVKDEKKHKTIIVTAKENPKFNMNKSSVDTWITKRNNYTVNNTSSNGNEQVAVITSDSKTEMPVTIEVKEVDESKPIASIMQSVSGGPAPLTITFSNATKEKSYEWNIGGYIIDEESYTHVFEVPGTYKVRLTVKNAKGIKSQDEVEITVGEPAKKESVSKFDAKKVNVFTPNNDGVNDYFFIEAQFENIESFILQISNIKGEVIFETTDADFKWDGRMRNGEILPTGTYFYHYIAVGKDESKYRDSNSFSVTK